jgi:hypothetical protein
MILTINLKKLILLRIIRKRCQRKIANFHKIKVKVKKYYRNKKIKI